MGDQELLVVLGLKAEGYFIVGVEHPHGDWSKQPLDDGEHGADVAFDHGDNLADRYSKIELIHPNGWFICQF